LESGSGPGGRRFKSSLPDQYFQSLTINFWSATLSGVGEIEAAKASKINNPKYSWLSHWGNLEKQQTVSIADEAESRAQRIFRILGLMRISTKCKKICELALTIHKIYIYVDFVRDSVVRLFHSHVCQVGGGHAESFPSWKLSVSLGNCAVMIVAAFDDAKVKLGKLKEDARGHFIVPFGTSVSESNYGRGFASRREQYRRSHI
jgi:hypothetical protein